MPGISFAVGNRFTFRYSRVPGSRPRIEFAGLDVCHSKYSRLERPRRQTKTHTEIGGERDGGGGCHVLHTVMVGPLARRPGEDRASQNTKREGGKNNIDGDDKL